MRILLGALAILSAAALHAQAADKVLRYAFEAAETSFDPARVNDLYSNIVNQAMFDAPLTYDYLARPARLKPNTVTALPEVSADGRSYTFHVKPGIYFADDPVFKGKPRELVAADYVYSMKRLLDARLRASLQGEIEPYIVGATEAAEKSRKTSAFDYDAPIEGLKVIDRYTFRVTLKDPTYVFVYNFADCRVACAVAREVMEAYQDDSGSHPVGTGAWRIAFWKRTAKIVLEHNPSYREELFDGTPPKDDARGQEILAKLKGRKLPLVDRVEISIIEEDQPRWLAFLNGEMDMIWGVPESFAYQGMPNNKLAPNLARKGITMEQVPSLDLTYNFFYMNDPDFGGYTPEKVALRRAISLSYKTQDEIAIIRKGQAIQAQAPYSPGVAGFDPSFRTSAGEYDIAKAKALLDMYGYVDRDGDGYREKPDGSPLVLHFSSTPTGRDQMYDELWKRSLDDIGIKLEVVKAKWPDILKAARRGKVQFWQLGGSAASPDADTWLASLSSSNPEGNIAKFALPEYDALYQKARAMPDSPGRTKIYQRMAKLVVAYVPWKINTHRIRTDMWYPQVYGYRRHPIMSYNFWKYIDADPSKVPQ